MKILLLSDQPSDYLWGPGIKSALAGIDLILSCGDLPPEYLEFIVTFSKAPLLYVHGNHDRRRGQREPEGCECIDDRLVQYGGLRILGLGGSVRYNNEGLYQYTQKQMRRRVRKLWFPIHRHQGFDILLTHAGARGIGDGEDRAHAGFDVFNELLQRWNPAFFIHGHSHLNYSFQTKRLGTHGQTQVINAFERYVLEIPDPIDPAK